MTTPAQSSVRVHEAESSNLGNTTTPEKEMTEIEKSEMADAKEIMEALLDIRRRTGFGSVVIDIQRGEVIEITISIKRRPKLEKKTYGDKISG